MNLYLEAVKKIIVEQEQIIGPLAYDQASKVAGLEVTKGGEFKLTRDGKDVLDDLVHKYSEFFGQASIEVCKDAISHLSEKLEADSLPKILQK